MPQPEQLPGPNADIWEWQLQGLCRGVDSSVFFHPDGEPYGIWGGLSETERELLLKREIGRTRSIRRTA